MVSCLLKAGVPVSCSARQDGNLPVATFFHAIHEFHTFIYTAFQKETHTNCIQNIAGVSWEKKQKSSLCNSWGRSSKFMSGTENDRQNWLPLHQVATLLSLSHSFSLCDWQHPGSAQHLIKNHHIIPAVSQYLNINTEGSPPPPPHSIWQRQSANELHHYEKALTGDGGMWDRWRKGSVE